LLSIYSQLGNRPIKKLEQQYQGKGYGEFKKDLAKVVVEFLRPIQKKYREVRKEAGYLDKIFKESLEKIKPISKTTLAKVNRAVGLG